MCPAYGNDVALSFDGSSGQGVFLDSQFVLHKPGDGTVEFWMNYEPGGHRSVLWTRSNSQDSNRFNFFINGNLAFGFDYRSPSGSLHQLVGAAGTGVPIVPNEWIHVAVTRTENVYELFFDGVSVATATDQSPDLPTAIGWHISGRSGHQYRGRIDEVRTSAAALTPQNFLLTGGPADSCACDGDTNGDEQVDVLDLLAVAGAWGTTGDHVADVTGDGVVDILDIIEVLGNWGSCDI